jgi:hypothetical protein
MWLALLTLLLGQTCCSESVSVPWLNDKPDTAGPCSGVSEDCGTDLEFTLTDSTCSRTDSCNGTISQVEYEGLEALYVSLNGEDWLWKNASTGSIWSFPSSLYAPCGNRWQGLSCQHAATDLSLCEIVALELEAYDLRGELPSQLYTMGSLASLRLPVNRIQGTLFTALPFLSICAVTCC